MDEFRNQYNSIHHLCVRTSASRDEINRFYSSTMGFKKLREVKNGRDLLLYFELSNDLMLEVLIDPDCPPAGDADSGGFVHFAFTVERIEPWVELIRDEGLEITYGPAVLDTLKINTFLFRDPFGAVWEFMEEIE